MFWFWIFWNWDVKVLESEETKSFTCSKEIKINLLRGGMESWSLGYGVWVSMNGGVDALWGGEVNVLEGGEIEVFRARGGVIGEGWESDPIFLFIFFLPFIIVK